MSARRRDAGGETIVGTFTDSVIDGPIMQAACEHLLALRSERNCRQVVLRFRNVQYLDSAALGKLITLHKRLSGLGCRIVLCSLDPQIAEVLELIKLNRLFIIREDWEAEHCEIELGLKPSPAAEQPGDSDPVILPFHRRSRSAPGCLGWLCEKLSALWHRLFAARS